MDKTGTKSKFSTHALLKLRGTFSLFVRGLNNWPDLLGVSVARRGGKFLVQEEADGVEIYANRLIRRPPIVKQRPAN